MTPIFSWLKTWRTDQLQGTLVGAGAGKALGKGGGIGLKVMQGGILRVGDEVSVIEES